MFFMTTAALQRWGNSQGFRIPKQLLRELNWKVNDELVLSRQDNKLVIEPVHPRKRKTIKELFEGYTGTYQTQEIDWGEPVGNEVW